MIPTWGPSHVRAIAFTSANISRAPTSYVLYGGNDFQEAFTEIARGPIPPFDRPEQRFRTLTDDGPATHFRIYAVVFPTKRGPLDGEGMEVKQIELLDRCAGQDPAVRQR